MTTSDLKLHVLRQIDALEKSKLEELYGILANILNGEKDISDWDKLSGAQKQGIFDAIDEIDAGERISNKSVLIKIRKKHLHG